MTNFDNLTFSEKLEKLTPYIDDIHTREELLEFAKYQIDEDSIFLALHVLEAVNGDNAEYYNYDFGMGTLETPTPIKDSDDLEYIIDDYSDYINELISDGKI